jgi:hypothetical protein
MRILVLLAMSERQKTKRFITALAADEGRLPKKAAKIVIQWLKQVFVGR